MKVFAQVNEWKILTDLTYKSNLRQAIVGVPKENNQSSCVYEKTSLVLKQKNLLETGMLRETMPEVLVVHQKKKNISTAKNILFTVAVRI